MRKKTRPYIVGYACHLPRLPLTTQVPPLKLVCDRIVTEGERDGVLMGSLALLTETLPPGAIVALYRLRILTGQGTGSSQRRVDAAVDAIEACGGDRRTVLWEIDPALNRRSDTCANRDIMLRGVRDEILRASQGDGGGRPERPALNDNQRAILDKHWPSARHRTNAQARLAIKAEARARGVPRIGGLSVQSLINILGPSGRGRLRKKPNV